jgi:ABC-type lipoprotein export system ATPase subunit
MEIDNSNFLRGSEWRKWDLHVHSNASDGKASPEEIIKEAVAKGIKVIALTDHHTVRNIDEIKRIGVEKGIRVISGIEFRTEYGSSSVHMIGLFPDYHNTTLLNAKALNELILCPLKLSETEIIAKGKEHNQSYNDEQAFKKGMFLVQVDFKTAAELIHKYSGIVSVHAGSKSNTVEEMKHQGASPKNVKELYDSLGTVKEELLQNQVDICEIRKENDNEDFYYNQFRLPSIIASDAHEKNNIGEKFVWIKADATFDGLKQIIYEPKERVRIQETNPDLDFEKAPFTEINFNTDVAVFHEESDNVTFQRCTLPLNNNLISIIGGRGTGKSILIDYISAGFGKETKHNYTKGDNIIIKRKASLKDDEQVFCLADNPNIPFMYISQSQIKNIVGNTKEFTKNIRETIGVVEEYNISSDYKEKSERYINEYFGAIKILEANNTTSIIKKENIEKEIKRYNEFITNITSQENRPKLEKYKEQIGKLEWRKSWYENLIKRKDSILQFEREANVELEKMNNDIKNLNLNIPLLNTKNTIDYIQSTIVPAIEKSIQDIQSIIDETKKTFAGYSGDLTTLLDNVNVYQKKVVELQQEEGFLKETENKFDNIKQGYFRELGEHIYQSILDYTTKIQTQWGKFKSSNEGYTKEMKQLLSHILDSDNLNVTVNVLFDSNKMYELLLSKLDGRSYSIGGLRQILKITSLEDFYNFIKQTRDNNLFNDNIRSDLRGQLLELFFKRYTKFILHNIIVTSNGKNITKLSHGQQGTIYLRMKLAANLFSETIIYDQPEDDLDNDFIMSDLVSIFREIKKYRQVIIISHNANLVVNADSEQIIIAKNEDGKLCYTSGSLENPDINIQVCNILEGGKRAFENREKKYGFMSYPKIS